MLNSAFSEDVLVLSLSRNLVNEHQCLYHEDNLLFIPLILNTGIQRVLQDKIAEITEIQKGKHIYRMTKKASQILSW